MEGAIPAGLVVTYDSPESKTEVDAAVRLRFGWRRELLHRKVGEMRDPERKGRIPR